MPKAVEKLVKKTTIKRAVKKVAKKIAKKVTVESNPKKREKWVTASVLLDGRRVYGIKRESGGPLRRHFSFTLRGFNANCGAAEMCFPVALHYDDRNFPKSADNVSRDLIRRKKFILMSKARNDRFNPKMENKDFLWKYFGFKRFANPRGNHGRYVMEYFYLTEGSYNARRAEK